MDERGNAQNNNPSNSLKAVKYFIYFLAVVLLLLVLMAIVKLWPNDLQSPKFVDMVAFLGFILAFATFASYFLFEINKRDIEAHKKQLEADLEKKIQSGRYFTSAQMLKVAGYADYGVYNSFREILELKLLIKNWNLNKNQPSNDSMDKNIEENQKEISSHINYAIQSTELAIKLLRKTDTESLNELVTCICNGNLAHYLAERGSIEDIERASILIQDLKDKIKKYPVYANSWLDTFNFVNKKLSEKKNYSSKPRI